MVSCSCYIFANLYASVIPFDKEEYRYLIMNFPDHIILYIPNVICACTSKKKKPPPHPTPYCECLVNLGFQQSFSTFYSHTLATHASLAVAIENNAGKASPKDLSPHHLSF